MRGHCFNEGREAARGWLDAALAVALRSPRKAKTFLDIARAMWPNPENFTRINAVEAAIA